MNKKIVKRVGMILLAAGLSVGMSCPSASAAVKIDQVSKSARYVQPEEWNKEELKAYQFDSKDDYANYVLTGGLHLYNNKYKGKDGWVKIKIEDPGIFIASATSEEDDKIPLYNASKTKVLAKDITEDDEIAGYVKEVKAGDEFYIKLPSKIKKDVITVGVIKDQFTSMEEQDEYLEAGKGTTSYHTFSIRKRSETVLSIFAQYKNGGKVSARIEKYVNGKWTKIGYTANIKNRSKDDLSYGLEAGKYRVGLTIPKGQIAQATYDTYTRKKKFAYKKSKAQSLKDDEDNIYTQGEKAARWYKVSVQTTKHKNQVWVAKDSVGGGYKFSVYQKGKKKAVKTVKVKKNERYTKITLPKKKGVYYIKVSKLTDKTNGRYLVEDYTY